jgi:hypothetical protein
MTDSEEPTEGVAPEERAAEPSDVYPPRPKGSGIPRSEDLSMVMARMLFRPRPKTAGLLSRFKRRGPKPGG